MSRALRSTALRLLALAGMAALAGLIANGLASPARQLAWSRSIASPPVQPPLAQPATSLPPVGAQASAPEPPAPAASLPLPKETTAGRTVTQVTPHAAAPAPVKPAGTQAVSPIQEVDGAAAWKAFQAGTPFLDARRSGEFAEGHIAGAWCTPVWEADLEDRLLAFKAARRPGPEDPILIYCSGGDCKDSHLLAAKLLDQGYFHLLIYRGGFPDWVAQKRPIEKGQP